MTVTALSQSIETLTTAYAERNPRSRELFMRAQASLPGGNTRTGVMIDPFPFYADHGEGMYLIDVDGHRILDFVCNNSSLILGHSHPAVVSAIQRQAARGSGFSRPTELEIELAEELRRRMPSLERVRFCNSGTEAVMNALRAAKAFTGRSKIAKFEGAYHGTSDYALVGMNSPIEPAIGPAERPNAVPSSAGLSAAANEVVILPFNDLDACRAIMSDEGDDVAAIIADPIMTGAGLILPDPSFLAGLRDLAHASGALLIFDEVISFRISSGGAQCHYDIRPDLTALGKVIAGGTPGGAFGGRADVMALFDPSSGAPAIPQAGTFNANPITLAAGLATLRELDDATYARMNQLAARLSDALQTELIEVGIPGQVVSIGSIFRVRLMDHIPRNYRETMSDDKQLHRFIFFWLLNNDVLWTQGGYIAKPSEDRHLDKLCSTFRAALRSLTS